jgi:hypothetical protein
MHSTFGRWLSTSLLLASALFPLAARAQDLSPKIDHQAVAAATKGEPLILRARLVSMSGMPIAEPAAFVRLPGVTGFSRLPMKPDLAFQGLYAAEIPASYVVGDLDYYLESFDADGNGPGRAGSPEAPFHVVVSAPAPAAAAPAPVSTPTIAWLKVETTPAGAVVSIDGLRTGTSPQRAPVSPGVEHKVQIERDGYEPFEMTAQPLPANAEGLLTLELEPRPSNVLFNASAILFQPGMFGGGLDFGFGSVASIGTGHSGEVDEFAVKEARGIDLSFTYVLADHHGIAIDATFTSLKLQTDVSGYEEKVVATGKSYSTSVGYRAYLGPFSVVRPHLGLLLGARLIAIDQGDASLGWAPGEKSQLQPIVEPELGISIELPIHVSLDVLARAGVLSYFDGLPTNTFGAGLGCHF